MHVMSEIMSDQVPGKKNLGLTKGGRKELFGAQSKCYSSGQAQLIQWSF